MIAALLFDHEGLCTEVMLEELREVVVFGRLRQLSHTLSEGADPEAAIDDAIHYDRYLLDRTESIARGRLVYHLEKQGG